MMDLTAMEGKEKKPKTFTTLLNYLISHVHELL